MASSIRSRLTFANVISVTAMFLALGGGAYALTLKKNSVGSKQIKPNAVKGSEAKESSFGVVPNATNASTLGGNPSSSFLQYDSSVPSGTTITGAFGGLGFNDGTASGGGFYNTAVSFPIPAPDGLTDAEVNFDDDTAGTIAGDETSACTGTPTSPTAPPGQVCLYVTGPGSGGAGAAGTADGTALPGTNGSGGSSFGFGINLSGDPSTAEIYGVWAYQAP